MAEVSLVKVRGRSSKEGEGLGGEHKKLFLAKEKLKAKSSNCGVEHQISKEKHTGYKVYKRNLKSKSGTGF